MDRRTARAAVIGLVALMALAPQQARAEGAAPIRTEAQVEADWLEHEELARFGPGKGGISPAEDALGAVDGVRNGKWGFHTNSEVHPWWQVDLGRSMALDRVLVFNRCDIPDRAARLVLQLSDDGKTWADAYHHDGTRFLGQPDGKPLGIRLKGARARYVRITLADEGPMYLHLDEVEVYATDHPDVNVALWHDALQSSVSPWSVRHIKPADEEARAPDPMVAVERGRKLAAALAGMGVDAAAERAKLGEIEAQAGGAKTPAAKRDLYLRARRVIREMAFRNPLLDFRDIVFVKRAPGQYSHRSDQNYGWWSRPGGGIFVLKDFRSDSPSEVQLTPADMEGGSFGRIDLSWDAKRIVFAWCRYYPNVATNPNKTDKASLPEDAFYHVFEMNAATTTSSPRTFPTATSPSCPRGAGSSRSTTRRRRA
jgi:hypothetical protein